jgi:DNA polymerase
VNRFALAPPAPARRPDAPTAAAPIAASHSGGDPLASTAARLANGARSLADLRQALESFDDCPLKRTATTTVFGDGNPDARVMAIGEAPGAEEDRMGLPFVGPSGKLLDRMLASIGLERSSNLYITNVINWRPPGNRKPSPEEVAMLLPFIERHIELVDPEILVLFGGAAASALFAHGGGISQLRGRWQTYQTPGLPRPIHAIATYHPAFLLRTPGKKNEAWRDLLAVRKRLDGML